MSNRTITESKMASLKRIAVLQSAITDAVISVKDVTYEELLVALAQASCRWAERNWREEFIEPIGPGDG